MVKPSFLVSLIWNYHKTQDCLRASALITGVNYHQLHQQWPNRSPNRESNPCLGICVCGFGFVLFISTKSKHPKALAKGQDYWYRARYIRASLDMPNHMPGEVLKHVKLDLKIILVRTGAWICNIWSFPYILFSDLPHLGYLIPPITLQHPTPKKNKKPSPQNTLHSCLTVTSIIQERSHWINVCSEALNKFHFWTPLSAAQQAISPR